MTASRASWDSRNQSASAHHPSPSDQTCTEPLSSKDSTESASSRKRNPHPNPLPQNSRADLGHAFKENLSDILRGIELNGVSHEVCSNHTLGSPALKFRPIMAQQSAIDFLVVLAWGRNAADCAGCVGEFYGEAGDIGLAAFSIVGLH